MMFTIISPDQYLVQDNESNQIQMGHLIKDSLGTWIYYTERRSLILTVSELTLLVNKLKELNNV